VAELGREPLPPLGLFTFLRLKPLKAAAKAA
jgi:hypothetical protein